MFRSIEMYKNLLHNPMNVTKFEIASLEQRRSIEKQLILDRDLSNTEEDLEIDSNDES